MRQTAERSPPLSCIRRMIQEGWVRRCQHTRLWIHPCERPSSCASRRRLQSAKANTDWAEGILSRLESLPRKLTPSLGVPRPGWADPEIHNCNRATAASTGKGVAGTIPDHLPCSQPNILKCFESFVWQTWCSGRRDSRECWGYETLCQHVAFSLRSQATGAAAPFSSMGHVCYFMVPSSFFCSFPFMFSYSFFSALLLCSFLLIILSQNPSVVPHPQSPNVTVHL